MVFPSYIFIFIFLPIVLIFWLSKLSLRVKLLILTVSSYIFYGWWDYRFVSLLIASSIVDYICGEKIYQQKQSGKSGKSWLALSITFNLFSLCFFKYWDFFAFSLQDTLGLMGINVDVWILNLVLPIGISFYTFQSMSYSLDIYSKELKPTSDWLHFFAYVSLFPQLVAGPIVRYADLETQLHELKSKRFELKEFNYGIYYFSIGLFKKCLVADEFSNLAEFSFDGQSTLYIFTAWISSIAYSLQLYFDFSGYSDMAMGLGFMLGFRFPKNFDSPYKSENISQFWRRWHITLSSFLRDYLFIPLGGSKGGSLQSMRNLMITMFLGGLWHGAAWTFVVWGILHGFALSLHSLYQRSCPKIPKLIAIIITSLFVNCTWVLFRAPSFERAIGFYKAMLGFEGMSPSWFQNYNSSVGEMPLVISELGGVLFMLKLFLALCLVYFFKNSHEIKFEMSIVTGSTLGGLMVWVVLKLSNETPFIYFQF